MKNLSTTEIFTTYYDKKWAEMYGIAPEDVKDAIKMICEITQETDYDEDLVEAMYVHSYHNGDLSKIPNINILDKFKKKENTHKPKIVKWYKYE